MRATTPAAYVPRRAAETGELPLEVVSWSRYGNHRLYVNTRDGRSVGWVDVISGQHTLLLEHLKSAFDEALAEPLSATPRRPHVPQRMAAEPEPRPLPPTPTFHSPDHAGPDFQRPPGFDPLGAPPPLAPIPSSVWAPPVGPPVVADLAANQPGAQLESHIRVARRAGEDARSWAVGALGERLVARELDRLRSLDPRWAYLNSIPVGDLGSDIDHLVVGPGGVFTLNAKHHPHANVWVGGNTVLVNGHRHPYVRNSRHEAERAARLLTAATGLAIRVRGLVVTVGADSFSVKQQPEDVQVLPRSELTRFLTGMPAVLDVDQGRHVLDFARLSSTWREIRLPSGAR